MRQSIAIAASAVPGIAWAAEGAGTQNGGATALALLVLIAAVACWMGLRSLARSLRAGKAQAVVRGDFGAYALEALANAARIDGRVNTDEVQAIARAMAEIGLGEIDPARVQAACIGARLNKDELVAYLAAGAGDFTREQKMALLKALLAVFVADGRFDETEHGALVDYTAAVGFDRASAPDMLRRLSRDFVRGNIT